MRRSASQTRKTICLATYRFLRAVRAPLNSDERTRQRGQGPPTCGREREALGSPKSGAECGGRVCAEEGAGAAHACVEVLEEWVVDYS